MDSKPTLGVKEEALNSHFFQMGSWSLGIVKRWELLMLKWILSFGDVEVWSCTCCPWVNLRRTFSSCFSCWLLFELRILMNLGFQLGGLNALIWAEYLSANFEHSDFNFAFKGLELESLLARNSRVFRGQSG
ncbi:hypothetical protein F0562_034556 [Nyssa sinensis]|uniref:Uncharacterized protein n=1 Tax=Nyssa sinensis TaxID=561372 RepID=A0A5J5AJR3_9ASTE|nr:hypothetical protein F0562_034556 [Nyssa sinensis]